jgi:hypothetical protein
LTPQATSVSIDVAESAGAPLESGAAPASGQQVEPRHGLAYSERFFVGLPRPLKAAGGAAMKNFDSRTNSLQDFVEYDKQRTLVLNPIFQRRAVWNEKAKSYLIDTILRGKPIPKIFMRQKINASTKSSIREVVDGQQRLRTILSFINDGFKVSTLHNPDYGGLYFSQLPPEVQTQLLSYEVSVDLLVNMPDNEILDIFGRLNSYAVVLNDQERINATHFSAFKIVADNLGFKYNQFWLTQKILAPAQILRMQEINLVADLLISLIEGIKSKKQIKTYYAVYERKFDYDTTVLERNFDDIMTMISILYPEGIANTDFARVHMFYSIFTAVAHCWVGLKGLQTERVNLRDGTVARRARNGLDHVSEIFSIGDTSLLSGADRQFINDSRFATTDAPVRERRTNYLLGLMA